MNEWNLTVVWTVGMMEEASVHSNFRGKNNVELSPVFSYVLTPTLIKWRDLYALMAPSRQISLQIWLRKPSIRTVFVELQCIYNHCSTYFQPLIQRYMARFSKNKVRKEHLRFNCEGDITLRFPTGFNGSVWNWKGQCARTFNSANSITIVICICLTTLWGCW